MKWLKKSAKFIIHHFPVPLTRNERCDRDTLTIIKKVCHPASVCIDIGAHNGKILHYFIKHASKGIHWAYEPIPQLFHVLKRKYGSAANIYQLALSNVKGNSAFNFVTTDMAYSGLKKRSYDRPEKDSSIQVKTDLLDNLVPEKQNITLIKIDVEGAELLVLQGAIKTIRRNKPVILFEFGKAGATAYDYDDSIMFDFIDHNLYYDIFTLKAFKHNMPPLSRDQFHQYFNNGKEFFFAAVPKQP